jgi:hypothetical protein
LDQWEISVYTEVPRFFSFCKRVPRTPSPLLLPLAPCSAPLLPCRRLSAPLTVAPAPPRRHLLLGHTPRIGLPLPRSCFPPLLAFPSHATPTRAPPGRHLAAAMSRARVCSSSFLCYFSVQFNRTNSFLSSCCSFWTGALPHFLAGTLSPMSSSLPTPRPPWEPHLRSSPPLPRTPRRCALSS